MIIQLDSAYLSRLSFSDVSELYYAIALNGHYLDCSNATLILMQQALEESGNRKQKSVVRRNYQGHLTAELRKYLTTIVANHYGYDELMIIVSKPSCLLIENLAYESDVYRGLIGTYTNDPKFGNLFKKLDQAKRRGWFTFLHAGGCGMMRPLLEYYETRDYRGVTDKKIAVLMDRDTDNGTSFPSRRNSLFSFLAGKDAKAVTNADIYSLHQNEYIWHMWYKRAIENYFPPIQYDNLGMPSVSAPAFPVDWSYKNLSARRGIGIRGYDKNRLHDVSIGMSRNDYENHCDVFSVDGQNMTEMQLFLLKLVRLI